MSPFLIGGGGPHFSLGSKNTTFDFLRDEVKVQIKIEEMKV